MKIAIAGFMHESNTFAARPTTRDDFTVQVDEQIAHVWGQAHHEVGGFIEGIDAHSCELVPLVMAGATPGGTVTQESLDWWISEVSKRSDRISTCDGMLLALHGAMVVEGFPDGDGEVLKRVRDLVGKDFPLVVTHDFHANVSEAIIEHSTALVIYKTNPHIDQRARGKQATDILIRTIRGEVSPVQALARPPMLWNILHQNTSSEPLRSIFNDVRALERNPRILAASVAAGFPYADVPEVGPSVCIVTDGDHQLAKRETGRLANHMLSVKDQLAINIPDAREAVRLAIASDEWPVVLVDMGDNIGGGTPGDSTFVLDELLRQNATGWVVVIADPGAVQTCAQRGVGAKVDLSVGGKTDSLHGVPVSVSGKVLGIYDGRFEETQPRHGGSRLNDQGLTAVIEVGQPASKEQSLLVLTTNRQPPFSLQQLISLGIKPEKQRILVVKAAIAYRAAYEPIARRIIEIDSPGITAVNLKRVKYVNVSSRYLI